MIETRFLATKRTTVFWTSCRRARLETDVSTRSELQYSSHNPNIKWLVWYHLWMFWSRNHVNRTHRVVFDRIHQFWMTQRAYKIGKSNLHFYSIEIIHNPFFIDVSFHVILDNVFFQVDLPGQFCVICQLNHLLDQTNKNKNHMISVANWNTYLYTFHNISSRKKRLIKWTKTKIEILFDNTVSV